MSSLCNTFLIVWVCVCEQRLYLCIFFRYVPPPPPWTCENIYRPFTVWDDTSSQVSRSPTYTHTQIAVRRLNSNISLYGWRRGWGLSHFSTGIFSFLGGMKKRKEKKRKEKKMTNVHIEWAVSEDLPAMYAKSKYSDSFIWFMCNMTTEAYWLWGW